MEIRWLKLAAAALTVACGVGVSQTALAQDERVYSEEERYGTWEVALHVDRIGSQMVTGLTSAALDVEDDVGWGASIAYNINNHWSVGLEFLSASPDYEPILGGEEPAEPGNYEMDLSSTMFKGTWHMREDGLTPYVSLGAGWTYVDSNIASGRPRNNCWFDPWWGYYCSSYYPTYDDNRTTLSASVGLRWDFHKRFFTRVNYGKAWIGLDEDDSSPAVASFAIGFRH